MQEAIDFHVTTLQGLATEKLDFETRAKAEQKRAEDVRLPAIVCSRFLTRLIPKIGSKWTEQVKLTEKYKSEVSRLEGALARKMSELERQGKIRSTPGSAKEAQLQGEVDKCMSLLKCSTCRLNLRTTVLTKCMHSRFSFLVRFIDDCLTLSPPLAFCKQCVDARISTRQRKCPACNLAFGQGDVQQLYFQ